VRKQLATGDEYYVYEGDQVVFDVNGSGAILREYAWYPGGVDRLLAMRTPTDTLAALLDPVTGTVRGLARFRNGARVKEYNEAPWGDAVADTGLVVRYRFAGREWDQESGLYYMRARYYDPTLGRWVSEDPLGLGGGGNLFGYAGGDPVNGRDPSGLAADDEGEPCTMPNGSPGVIVDGQCIPLMEELFVTADPCPGGLVPWGGGCMDPFDGRGFWIGPGVPSFSPIGGGTPSGGSAAPTGANKGERKKAPLVVAWDQKTQWRGCNLSSITYVATIGPPPLQRGVFTVSKVEVLDYLKVGPLRIPAPGGVGVYRGGFFGPVGRSAIPTNLPAQAYVDCGSGYAMFQAYAPTM
jgi:RHS repeat-associated protein